MPRVAKVPVPEGDEPPGQRRSRRFTSGLNGEREQQAVTEDKINQPTHKRKSATLEEVFNSDVNAMAPEGKRKRTRKVTYPRLQWFCHS